MDVDIRRVSREQCRRATWSLAKRLLWISLGFAANPFSLRQRRTMIAHELALPPPADVQFHNSGYGYTELGQPTSDLNGRQTLAHQLNEGPLTAALDRGGNNGQGHLAAVAIRQIGRKPAPMSRAGGFPILLGKRLNR